MPFTSQQIPYKNTNAFSKIILDYVDAAPALQPFYKYKTNIEEIKRAIEDRAKYPIDRQLLVNVLKAQYANIEKSKLLQTNIDALINTNTFTITTAHQPNIFTGHLYFIYKILHAIKLAET